MKERKKAYITGVADDQGSGSSWCSNCRHPLDGCMEKWSETSRKNVGRLLKAIESNKKYKIAKAKAEVKKEEKETKHYICPKCGAKLEFGGLTVSHSGSDF